MSTAIRQHGTDEASETAWCGFVRCVVAVFGGGLALVLAFIVLIDPYDSGRFPSLGLSGISDETQRTANVSLGRSSRFDAAIFGNSHGQLLDPERLSQATGLSFVQLTIPGANAPEAIAVMRWFIRHHARIGALVLAVDDRWCTDDPQPWKWFPFWLYGDSDVAYVANAFNSRSLGAAVRRIEHAFNLVHPSDPRGYEDYERRLSPGYRFIPPALPSAAEGFLAPNVSLGARLFPAIDALAVQLSQVSAMPIVILFPPRYYSDLPLDAGAKAVLAECKARFARLAAGSPHGGFLDYMVESPMTHDPNNFIDSEHYRGPVARAIERAIAGILNGQGAPTPTR